MEKKVIEKIVKRALKAELNKMMDKKYENISVQTDDQFTYIVFNDAVMHIIPKEYYILKNDNNNESLCNLFKELCITENYLATRTGYHVLLEDKRELIQYNVEQFDMNYYYNSDLLKEFGDNYNLSINRKGFAIVKDLQGFAIGIICPVKH